MFSGFKLMLKCLGLFGYSNSLPLIERGTLTKGCEVEMDWERIAGGLVGLAVGDALGVPVEFVSRDILRQNPVEV